MRVVFSSVFVLFKFWSLDHKVIFLFFYFFPHLSSLLLLFFFFSLFYFFPLSLLSYCLPLLSRSIALRPHPPTSSCFLVTLLCLVLSQFATLSLCHLIMLLQLVALSPCCVMCYFELPRNVLLPLFWVALPITFVSSYLKISSCPCLELALPLPLPLPFSTCCYLNASFQGLPSTPPPPPISSPCYLAILLPCVGWYFLPPSSFVRKSLELGETSSPTTKEG